MSDAKDKAKAGIDKAADKTKNVTGKIIDKSKAAIRSTGEAIAKSGEKLKNAGK